MRILLSNLLSWLKEKNVDQNSFVFLFLDLWLFTKHSIWLLEKKTIWSYSFNTCIWSLYMKRSFVMGKGLFWSKRQYLKRVWTCPCWGFLTNHRELHFQNNTKQNLTHQSPLAPLWKTRSHLNVKCVFCVQLSRKILSNVNHSIYDFLEVK